MCKVVVDFFVGKLKIIIVFKNFNLFFTAFLNYYNFLIHDIMSQWYDMVQLIFYLYDIYIHVKRLHTIFRIIIVGKMRHQLIQIILYKN